MSDLLPCPFCGGPAALVENRARLFPSMGGPKREPQLLSVSITHHCPRHTDSQGNYPVLHQFVEVRGRDHETAVAAWNGRRG